MKKNLLLIRTVFAFLFFFIMMMLAACKKEEQNPTGGTGGTGGDNELPECSGGYRLSQRLFYGTGSWSFTYDSQGRLAQIFDDNTSSEDRYTIFEYSVDNKPDRVTVVELQGQTEVLIEERTITYSATRHPVSLVSFTPGDDSYITHRFTTDNQGNILIDSVSNAFYFVAAYNLTWENGNLVRSNLFSAIDNIVSNEFDNKPNPFYELRYCFLQTSSSAHYWSKNNVKSFTVDQSSIVITDDLENTYYDGGEFIYKNISGEYKYECK